MAQRSQKKILRIGIIHEGRIIEERLVRQKGHVTVGASPKCTFILPIPNLPESYRLFVQEKGRYFLRFTSRMVGKVSVQNAIMDLRELRDKGVANHRGDCWYLPLDENSRGRLVFGDVSLLFQFVVPPPPVPKLELPAAAKGGILSSLDSAMTVAFVLSLLLQAGAVGGIEYWWYSFGRFQVREHRAVPKGYEILKAQVIRQARPKPKVAEQTGKGAAGNKEENKGEKGEQERESRKHGRRVARRASSGPEDPTQAYKRRVAKVRSRTILRFLGSSGSGPAAVRGAGVEHGATAARIRSAWQTSGIEVAQADSPPSGFHAGRGGTGAAGTTYAKLDESEIAKDSGPRMVQGAQRTERDRVNIRIRTGSVGMIGGLGTINKAAVESVFKRRVGAIRDCYQRALRVNPNVSGKVTIEVTIGRAGTVVDIRVVSNTTGDPRIGDCIVRKVRTWRFPPAREGEVTIKYPFILVKD